MARNWHVHGIRWCGVWADDFDSMRRFATKTLGLELEHEGQGFLAADAANGDRFEVFSEGSEPPAWQFEKSPVVIGFLVDDIAAARDDLEKADGVELLGPLQGNGGMKWQHFRAPNGVVFELTWDERVTGRDRSATA